MIEASSHEYREDPDNPGYYLYGGRRIQAELATHRRVVEWVESTVRPGSRVLDVAAGQGALAQQLIDHGFDVSCTSWDEECQVDATCYSLDLDRPFSVQDVGGEPYPLVCCIEIIEHLENPSKFLRDCHSLVEPGGYLILSTPNVESAEARLQWLIRGQPRIFSDGEVRNNRHISMMWRDQLSLLIELAGFRVAERLSVRDADEDGGGRGLRHAVKWLAQEAIRRFAQGEPEGTTRMYVLERTGREPRRLGPDDVY